MVETDRVGRALRADEPVCRLLCAVFGCSEDLADQILVRGRLRSFDCRTTILRRGDQVTTLFVVIAGRAHAIAYSLDGQAVLLHEYGSGDFFGVVSPPYSVDPRRRCRRHRGALHLPARGRHPGDPRRAAWLHQPGPAQGHGRAPAADGLADVRACRLVRGRPRPCRIAAPGPAARGPGHLARARSCPSSPCAFRRRGRRRRGR